uniref:Transmembrane protein 151B n=1 Tax=Plectus sambesii TaxID=2011161 RepID=A0A914ULD2_9BILA
MATAQEPSSTTTTAAAASGARRTTTVASADANTQKPQRRNLFRSIRRNCHWKCLLITLLIDLCIVYVVWCRLRFNAYSKIVSEHGPCAQGYNFIPIAFGVMLFIVYIMECWHCRTRLDMVNQVEVNEVYDYVSKLKAAMPIVWWRSVCYHYIRRTRQVTRYRNGDAITTTQVYYERVNSHSAGNVFLYGICGVKDISKKLVDLELFPVTKIRFSKGFVFSNLQAANEFEEQRTRFFNENELRDDYMEVREGLDLVDQPFKDFVLTFANPNKRPWYTSQWTFWLLSMILLSWPLRVYVEWRTAYVNYQVTKLFGTNYLSPSSVNYTGPLTRTSSIDSRDLEAVAQNGFFIVPSYSEALLMDPVSCQQQIIHDRRGNIHIQTRQRWRQNGNEASDTLCNENVIPNYGAFIAESRLPAAVISNATAIPPLMPSSRSRSLSMLPRPGSRRQRERDRQTTTHRSISIGSLSAAAARYGNRAPIYQTLPTTPEDLDYPDEPPPTYEVALRMCAPLYERLRRSANSITRLPSFLQLSRSSSKDMASRSDLPGGSRDSDTLL